MKRKKFKTLTYTQRLQIETLIKTGKSKRYIADFLGVHISTVYRELKHGEYTHTTKSDTFWAVYYKKETRYSAQIAQERHKIACTSKGRPLKIGKDFELVNYIQNRVNKEKISACAVLGQIKHMQLKFSTTISKTTLYRYIELGLFDNVQIITRKKKYRKTSFKRAPKGTSIEKRPKEIKQRKTFGHWEMDCVCGSNRTTLLVLSERLTRREIIFKMENQKADSVIRCLNILEHKYGKLFKQVFKTITVDNGSEFSNFTGIEKSIYGQHSKRTQVFYCHPYCSCERGTNERLNREIRRLIPKGSALSKYSIEDIQKVEDWLNNYPRSVLNFATANELFDEQLSKLK